MQEICIKNIWKSFGGKPVLKDLSFTLPAGGRVCLTGPSGSGKTTLFRILTGLEHADSGSIFVRNRADMDDRKNLRRVDARTTTGLEDYRFGVVFQEDRLLEELSALQNVRLTASKGFADAQLRMQLQRILPADALDRPVSRLSGGMKRRVALARAVLSPADLLVLDEPFTGLDEETRARTAAWLLERQEERTVLFSSHQAEDAELMHSEIVSLTGKMQRERLHSASGWAEIT